MLPSAFSAMPAKGKGDQRRRSICRNRRRRRDDLTFKVRCAIKRSVTYRSKLSSTKGSWGLGGAAEFSPAAAEAADLASPSALAWAGGSSGPLTPQPPSAATATSAAAKTAADFRLLDLDPPNGIINKYPVRDASGSDVLKRSRQTQRHGQSERRGQTVRQYKG